MPIKNTKKSINTLYLSLGSNIGDRLCYIEEAILLINKQVGSVTKKASIYETPAWGFEGLDFLNTCIEIETQNDTKESLKLLQEIEKSLGRKLKTTNNYENRPIDIDIIYSSEGLFCHKNLIVPHKLLHDRKFVLLPLNDLIPNYKHPLLHKTTQQLLTFCNDVSAISVFKKNQEL